MRRRTRGRFLDAKVARNVERRIGPLVAIDAGKGLLLDELALVGADRVRARFSLLAGQMARAREASDELASSVGKKP